MGRLVRFMADVGRWHVLLNAGEAIKIRAGNLVLVSRKEPAPAPRVWRPLDRAPPASGGTRWPSSPSAALLEAHGEQILSFCSQRARLAFAETSRDAADAIAMQGRLYVCGGTNGESFFRSMECFDLASGRWTAVPPMLRKRSAAGQAAVGGKLFVLGGGTGSGPSAGDSKLKMLDSVERFDPMSGSWQTMPPMSQRRSFPMTSVLKGRIYVCGGCTVRSGPDDAAGFPLALGTMPDAAAMGQGERDFKTLGTMPRLGHEEQLRRGDDLLALSSLERFSPERREWQTLPSMKAGRYLAVPATSGGRLYIAAGTPGGDARELATLEAFDPEVGAWEELASMAYPRAFAAGVWMNKCFYVLGGVRTPSILNTAERYCSEEDRWYTLPPMNMDRCGACAYAMPRTNRIYVCGGGLTPVRHTMYSLEAFDVETGHWEVLRPMARSRSFSAAVVVASYLYILGGQNESEVLNAAERLNLLSGTSETLPPLAEKRLGATAVLLPS